MLMILAAAYCLSEFDSSNSISQVVHSLIPKFDRKKRIKREVENEERKKGGCLVNLFTP